jgi:hypothetical protein
MDLCDQFTDLLATTAQTIEYAIHLIPMGRLFDEPPHASHPNSDKGFKTYFGQWSAGRLLFHLIFYEETYALPAMRHWVSQPHPELDLIFPDSDIEEKAWKEAQRNGLDLEDMLGRFGSARSEQIDVLGQIPLDEIKQEKVKTGLGRVSAAFVVSKTIQHSLEHGNDLMKNALYWDRALMWLDEQA